MAYLAGDEVVQAWYISPGGRQRDIASAAFEEAVEHLKRELQGRPQALAWIETCQSIDKIQVEAEDIEKQYRGAGAAKTSVLQCMRKISSWILHYGQVLDMLAQHHPEYVSLAWGAAKFVLMGVLNHEKIATEISQALSDIAAILPRTELHAKLYPTERMKDSMAHLYAHLLLFLREAVKWFSRNSTGRMITAIFKPFELKQKRLIEQIEMCSRIIDDEASAASKAEVRGLHIDVQQNGKSIAALDGKMDETHRAHQARLDRMDTKLEKIHIEIKEIRHRVAVTQDTLGDTRTRVIDLQLNAVLRHLSPKILPEDSLRKQRAIIKRAMPWFHDNRKSAEQLRRLNNWISTPAPSLLVLQAGPRAQTNAKALATELIGLLEAANIVVVWHLADPGLGEEVVSRTAILRSLAFQLIRTSPDLMSSAVASLDASRIQGRHDEAEWMDLVCLMLSQLPRCFLLLEADGGPRHAKHGKELLAMLEDLTNRCQKSTCLFKAMLLSNNKDLGSSACRSESSIIMTVERPGPKPPHLRSSRGKPIRTSITWSKR